MPNVFARGSADCLGKKMTVVDALQTNVMLADSALNITYMNPSVIALMREAEVDLKEVLPGFSVNHLVGSNIDVFHKNPHHQRTMLATLDRKHSATITVGKRVLVTPIFPRGKRIAFVVEWSDARARILNIDCASKMVAVNRNHAVIEFTTDGTIIAANDHFLKAVGYPLEEIVGKHHRIFVDPDDASGADYETFWTDLRQGRFRAGQFKRISKSGALIWIEGAYNPILDETGQVSKIVKFATDVTAQVRLLADLKSLIDHNFSEIGRAIGQSEQQARAASDAAGMTLHSVQTVAAATGQLAASIKEIAISSTKSQTAADKAVEQSSSVGSNTSKLMAATREMNGIVDIIRNIAAQINLLALNATIESARAGDAGKGFAVVASEVKNLANQSASATERISKEIEGVQATSADVARAIENIQVAISLVRDHVTDSASAVEEQNAVTASISADMQSAAKTVSAVSNSIVEISSAVARVSQSVVKTREAASVLVH
jgi:PAS domain S-box-containing protein